MDIFHQSQNSRGSVAILLLIPCWNTIGDVPASETCTVHQEQLSLQFNITNILITNILITAIPFELPIFPPLYPDFPDSVKPSG